MYVPRGEPRGLFWLFVAGVLLVVAALGTATWLGLSTQGWNANPSVLDDDCGTCKTQKEDLESRAAKLKLTIDLGQLRVDQINLALVSGNAPSAFLARLAKEPEERSFEETERLQKTATVRSMSEELPDLLVSLALIVLVALATARAAARHGESALGPWPAGPEGGRWRRVHACWVAIIFVPDLVREIITSVLAVHKDWFGWTSFCVSHETWGLMLVVYLGMDMVIAYPATILWCQGSATRRPKTLDPSHVDGRWGMEGYLLFVQTWAYLPLFCVVLPTCVSLAMLRDVPGVTTAYLVPALLLVANVAVVSGRMIWNAIQVRLLYRRSLKALGSTWAQIRDADAPPDPTVPFLGDNWWKLPAILLGGASSLWLMVDALGIREMVMSLVRH